MCVLQVLLLRMREREREIIHQSDYQNVRSLKIYKLKQLHQPKQRNLIIYNFLSNPIYPNICTDSLASAFHLLNYAQSTLNIICAILKKIIINLFQVTSCAASYIMTSASPANVMKGNLTSNVFKVSRNSRLKLILIKELRSFAYVQKLILTA